MSNSSVRTIRLRWPTRCSVCGGELAAGEQARWDGRARTATCLPCAAWASYLVDSPGSTATGQFDSQRVPSVLGTAGASALREYERRRTARERRARERAGVLGVWWSRLTGDPFSTRSWKQGGDGEAKVAERLERLLAGSGVHLLNDRRLPGRSRANVDHIAVGPGGITVIDAKTLVGRVRVESVRGLFGPRRRQLRVRGRDRTRLVYGVRGQAEAVRSVLARQGIDCDVRCALCFADAQGLPWLRQLELEGVTIAGVRRVAKLAARDGTLGAGKVERVVRVLAVQFPSA